MKSQLIAAYIFVFTLLIKALTALMLETLTQIFKRNSPLAIINEMLLRFEGMILDTDRLLFLMREFHGMKKVAMFALLYTALLITAFWYREPLWDWVNQTHYNQLPLMFLLAILFSMIPIVPFSVFAGLMGAKFGVLVGATINWTGSVGAAILFFVLVRYFFVEQFQLYISRFDKVQKFDQIIGRNGFIAVLFSRLIPIIPTPVVNIYSGLSPILFSQYMMATAIGQIPDTVVFAYLGKQLFTSVQSTVIVILIYVLFLLIVFVFYYWWYKSGSVKSQ